MQCGQVAGLLLDVGKGDCLVILYLSDVADDSRHITSIESAVSTISPISPPGVIDGLSN